MRRIVDANDLIKEIGKIAREPYYQHEGEDWAVGLAFASGIISEAETIDAVPVVRCRECIHYEMGVCLKIYDDGAASSYAWQERRPDDFCSYGKRKEGAD